MTPLEQLDATTSMLNTLVERTWFGQLDTPTGSGPHTVHDLIDRIIVLGDEIPALLRGEPLPEVRPPFVYGWVPASEFRDATAKICEAAHRPGIVDGRVVAPFGEMDGGRFVRQLALALALHGHDIARATGLAWEPEAALVDALSDTARDVVSPRWHEFFGRTQLEGALA